MDKKNFKDMWVHVEHDGKMVHSVSLELCCEIRKLCDQSGDALVAVVPGEVPEAEQQKLKACGVDKLLLVSGTGYER
ncbi:MAG: electron transfer flavoprotein subunit alpha, partial [Oscillospiraceae bacterium]|nr:electron transfer flavoprotein subunit alpha [Oscillospiraceae bacterium]